MTDFILKKGDRLPKLRMTLADSSGVALDLTGATVTFRMRARDGGALKVNAAATIISPSTAGVVEYAWQVADVDTAGVFDAEWSLAYANGTQTVPTSGYVSILVADVLA